MRERVAAAAVVADESSGLVEAAPVLAGQDGFDGVAGVEVGGGEAVPDGVSRGPQEWSGSQPVASLPAVTGAFPGADGSGVPSQAASASGNAAR